MSTLEIEKHVRLQFLLHLIARYRKHIALMCRFEIVFTRLTIDFPTRVLSFGQVLVDGLGAGGTSVQVLASRVPVFRLFPVKVVTLMPSEISMTIIAGQPHPSALVNLPTTVTHIVTFVTFSVIVTHLARVTVIASTNERGHARDDVVVSVVIVKIEFLLRFGTTVDDSVEMILGNHMDLIRGKNVLECFDGIDAAFV